MPNLRFQCPKPLNHHLIAGLVLGFCLFGSFGAFSVARAIDPGSSIFGQPSGAHSAREAAAAPLTLPEETPTPTPGLFSTFLRLIVALAITIGLVFLTIWGLKLVWEKRGLAQLADEGKPVRILHSTYLAPRKMIQLVEVGNRVLILGVGQEEINCLDIIHDPIEIASLRESTSTGFPKVLNRILKTDESTERSKKTKEMIRESGEAVGEYVTKLKKMKRKDAQDTADHHE